MPRLDGMGPQGMGPGTGWGRGPCVSGRGRGWRLGRGYGLGRNQYQAIPSPETKEEEIDLLQEESQYLKNDLKALEQRLNELKKKK